MPRVKYQATDDVAAECAILAVSLTHPECLATAAKSRLSPGDFTSDRRSALYQALLAVHADGGDTNDYATMLRAYRAVRPHHNEKDFGLILAEVIDGRAGTIAIEANIDAVLDTARNRRAIAIAEQVTSAAAEGRGWHHYATKLAELTAPPAETNTTQDIVTDLVERAGADQGVIAAIPCGMALLDETCGGLIRGDYAAIIGSPGVGKSLLADRLTIGVLERDATATAIVFALETAPNVRIARLLAGLCCETNEYGELTSSIYLSNLLRGRLDEHEKARIQIVSEQFASSLARRVEFDDAATSPTAIAATIRDRRPTVAVIDHVGLLELPPGGGIEATDAGLSQISTALRRSGTAGILIGELSKRALVERDNGIGAVRGSARFESLAAASITLQRAGQGMSRETMIDAALVKNRHGKNCLKQQVRLWGQYGYIEFGGGPLEEFTEPEPAKKRGRAE